jgi:hypothetical protein
MLRDRFRASVQYEDLVGTAAADRADGKNGPEDWLRNKGLMTADEFVLGIEIWSGENPGVYRDPLSVHFLITPGGYDSTEKMIADTSGEVPVRRITVEMKIAEFMGLFKRFSVCLSPGGMLTDKKYRADEQHST